MSIEIKVPTLLYPFTKNQPTAEVAGNTVGECLQHLVEKFPALKTLLFDYQGALNHLIHVFINQVSAHPDPLTRPVKDGDKILLTMVIGGG
jgi:molybdopterin converting factor small subunit